MRGKTWMYAALAGFVLLLAAAIGCSSAPIKTGPAGDTITVSLENGQIVVDKKIAYADREADLKWVRKDGQAFEFHVYFPKENPFDATAGKNIKSGDQDEKVKWHGIKEKVGKETAEGVYHYLIMAYVAKGIIILDPEIIVPRPGKG